MRSDRALIGLHAVSVALAGAAALVWPRPGQAALMVPIGPADMASVLRWADREKAALMRLDSASGRVVVRITDNRSLVRALGAGIVPVATRAPGCQESRRS
jgi:hypothetical protein